MNDTSNVSHKVGFRWRVFFSWKKRTNHTRSLERGSKEGCAQSRNPNWYMSSLGVELQTFCSTCRCSIHNIDVSFFSFLTAYPNLFCFVFCSLFLLRYFGATRSFAGLSLLGGFLIAYISPSFFLEKIWYDLSATSPPQTLTLWCWPKAQHYLDYNITLYYSIILYI